jgi:uncharacterized membrane protein (UPF0136 family)
MKPEGKKTESMTLSMLHTVRSSIVYTRQWSIVWLNAGCAEPKQKYALAVNRTRGSRMASVNFTTKPLVQ